MPTADQLQSLALFDGISDRHLQRLASLGLVQHYGTGTTLFQENSYHHTFYLVLEGTVALDIHVPRRKPKRILTVSAGDILAWSAILSDGRMTTSAVTLAPTQLIAWPADKLMQLCKDDHEVGFLIMHRVAQALSRRLSSTRLQLLDMLVETEPMPRPAD
jgi:CRP/FNR family cyclic AMP-dependent transcriptional regulator